MGRTVYSLLPLHLKGVSTFKESIKTSIKANKANKDNSCESLLILNGKHNKKINYTTNIDGTLKYFSLARSR